MTPKSQSYNSFVWNNIDMNDDGTIQTAVTRYGYIWTLNTQRIYSIDKYYPLFVNQEHAAFASPSRGSHTHELSSQTYWMPSNTKRSQVKSPIFWTTTWIEIYFGQLSKDMKIFVNGLLLDPNADINCQRGDFWVVNVALIAQNVTLTGRSAQNNYETIYKFSNTNSNTTTFIMNELGYTCIDYLYNLDSNPHNLHPNTELFYLR